AADDLLALLRGHVEALDMFAVLEVERLAVVGRRDAVLVDDLANLRRARLRLGLLRLAAVQLPVALGLLGLRALRGGRLCRGPALFRRLTRPRAARRALGLLDLLLGDEACLE